MKLLIDAGNTRIKWALLAGETWTHLPAVAITQAHTLAAQIATFPALNSVWVSNVAGENIAQYIQAACAARQLPVQFVRAQKSYAGVSNLYHTPAQLGADRWMALIAAWQMFGRAALVVNCGTATTIDALSARGEFLGGLIVPGIALMQHSLVANTAQLQENAGQYAVFPRNTADAIYSGALCATAAAIARQYEQLNDPHAPLILSGGAAQALQDLLKLPVTWVDDLVLQGLKIMSQETSA